MSWVEVAWIAMSAASLTLGVIHLLVWLKQRSHYAHLLFFALAISTTIFGVFELAMMRTQSPAEYAATLRFAHVPLAMVVLSMVWFVHFYFDAGRLWLALGGHRLSTAGARSQLRDRRERQLSRGFLARPGDAMGRRAGFRAGRCRKSMGDRAADRQRAPGRIRHRCIHCALASWRSRRAATRNSRRRQSRRLHCRRRGIRRVDYVRAGPCANDRHAGRVHRRTGDGLRAQLGPDCGGTTCRATPHQRAALPGRRRSGAERDSSGRR